MWQLGTPPLELVARTVIVYALFVVALRVFGKREIAQFTPFDLTLVLLAANALQPAITGADASIPGALIIIVTIFGLNHLVGIARRRSPTVRRLLEPRAAVIGRDGKWLPDALSHEGLDNEDLEAALREHGFETVSEVKAATLEEDGSISVIGRDRNVRMRARRRRYRRSRT